MQQLRDWLNTECDKRNLSWREASVRAGIYPGAISAIMNGQRPGLEVCKALAQSFGVSPEFVLRLAGHLARRSEAKMPSNSRLGVFVDRLSRLPARTQDAIMDAALLLLEINDAAQETKILPEPSPAHSGHDDVPGAEGG